MSKKTWVDAAIGVVDLAFAAGRMNAHDLLEQVGRDIDDLPMGENTPLHYQSGKRAYCKYCYSTHRAWVLSQDHWPPAWTCQRCQHTTLDTHMELS